MSDEAPKTTAVAVRPSPREYRVVESVSPIMDTARFEHLTRVATVMARAALMPNSLTMTQALDDKGRVLKDGNKDVMIPLDFEIIQARAFLIANQADLWKADPNAVAQCTSLVHGKLMFEGKLVHGLVETRLGVRLRYEFGTYDAKARSIAVGIMPGPDDQTLGVRVSGQFEDEDFDREIVGSVGMWHTGDKGPWSKATAWMRQLRYMGAREWTRAHSPGLLLGIMTDDEIDHQEQYNDRRAPQGRVKVALAERLAAPTEERQEGFNAAHVAEQTGGQAVEAEVSDGHRGTVETLTNDGEKEVTDTDEPCGECDAEVGVECAPGCSSWDDLAELPEHIAIARAAAEQAHDPETGEVIEGEDDPQSASDAAAGAGEGQAAENASADGTATGDGSSGTGATTGQQEPDDGFPGDKAMSGGQGDGEDRTEAPAAINAFWTEVANMTSWLSVKARIGGLYKADDWNELEPAEQAAERAKIWAFVDGVIKAKHKDPVDFAQDATAFRLWMETQTDAEGPDAVEGSLRVLQQAPVFLRQSGDFQKGFVATVEDWIKARRGKKR